MHDMIWDVIETCPIIIAKTNTTINRVEGQEIGAEVPKLKIEMTTEERKLTNLDQVTRKYPTNYWK